MSYLDIAKSLISKINEEYDIAYGDLEEITGNVELSLKEILPELKFVMKKVSDDYSGTIVRVLLDANPDDFAVDHVRIYDFFIPSGGYPISAGRYSDKTGEFAKELIIENRDGVDGVFTEMLTNNDSRVIQTIGFAMRRRK